MVEVQNTSDRHGSLPETSLWMAVVEEVIRTEPAEHARGWLQSDDGRMVAGMAGLDPDWICDRLLPALTREPRIRARQYRRPETATRHRPQSRRMAESRALDWMAAWG